MSARPDASGYIGAPCRISSICVAQPMGSVDLLAAQAVRAQAPLVLLAERHGRHGSRATWLPALPLPATMPTLQPMQGKPCSWSAAAA